MKIRYADELVRQLSAEDVPEADGRWSEFVRFVAIGHWESIGHYGSAANALRQLGFIRGQWLRGESLTITRVSAVAWLYNVWLEADARSLKAPVDPDFARAVLTALRELCAAGVEDWKVPAPDARTSHPHEAG